MAVKWAKMLRFEPPFHGSIEETEIYKSVKSWLKTANYSPLSGDFSSNFFRFLRNRKKSLEKSKIKEFDENFDFSRDFFRFR